ncbi:MAG: tripartite tricarboxylate transporter substrate binding protein [Betaproteobacteria bacterium]
MHNKSMYKAISILISGLFLFCQSILSFADEKYPSKAINLIVPFAPGGGNDLVARLLSGPLSTEFNQPVVVINKLGAGGSIGTAEVAHANPDGYNLVLLNSANITYPESEKLAGRKPLYELSELEPLALLSNDPVFIVIRADLPYKNIGEFFKAAQAKPGSIDYSSSGNLGPIHIQYELLGSALNTSFTQIQYKGVGPSMLALLGGEVHTTAVNPATLSAQLGSGKVRVLAVTGEQRHPLVPDAPTFKELGMLESGYRLWTGIYAPAGTPPDVLKKLNVAIANAVKSTRFTNGMKQANLILDYREPVEFKKFVDDDSKKVLKVFGKLITPETNKK